ncbi:MAG: flagellar biosynthetic protein FliO [bacterium]|nr:flagellar biosynthetic protein FliO [bacterium]
MSIDLVKTFASLAFVLGLIFVLAWAYKKYMPAGQIGVREQDGWRLLGTRALGPGRQIHVFEVGRKLLLIGATDKSLSTLMEIEGEEDCSMVKNALSIKPSVSFADVLRRNKS